MKSKISFLVFCLIISTSCFSMLKALNTAATGMSAQEANVNNISNNIANVNTIGFKKARVEFHDLYYQTVVEAGARSSAGSQYNVGVQIGTGTKVSGVRKEFSMGNPQVTERAFDLMINGAGFFGIIGHNEELHFTRDGAFDVNAQGILVTKQGNRVFPGFTFPANVLQVNISNNGLIEAYIRGQIEPVNVGTIPVFTFVNPTGLSSAGGNLYRMTQASGQYIQNIAGQNKSGFIVQGSLESSNVSIMNEMADLIKAQRSYEMNSKIMRVADEMLQTVNNIR